jgi:hypothetical protein
MAVLLKKRGKFLQGASYCTGFGNEFTWTPDEQKARRFYAGQGALESFRQQTGAKEVPVADTRQELKEASRRAVEAADKLAEEENETFAAHERIRT